MLSVMRRKKPLRTFIQEVHTNVVVQIPDVDTFKETKGGNMILTASFKGLLWGRAILILNDLSSTLRTMKYLLKKKVSKK